MNSNDLTKNKAIQYIKILEEYDQAESLYDLPDCTNTQLPALPDSPQLDRALLSNKAHERPWYQAFVQEAWEVVEKSIETSDQVLSNVYQSVEALSQTERMEGQLVTSSTTTNVVMPEGKRNRVPNAARRMPPSPEVRQPEQRDHTKSSSSATRIGPEESTEVQKEKKDLEAKKRAEIAKRRGKLGDASASTGPKAKQQFEERKEPCARKSDASANTAPQEENHVEAPKQPVAKKPKQVEEGRKQPVAKKTTDSTGTGPKQRTPGTGEVGKQPKAKKSNDGTQAGPMKKKTEGERKEPLAKKSDKSTGTGPKQKKTAGERKQPEAKNSDNSTGTGPVCKKTAGEGKQPLAKKSGDSTKTGPKEKRAAGERRQPDAKKCDDSIKPEAKKLPNASSPPERKDPPGSRKKGRNAEAASELNGDQPRSIARYDLEDERKFPGAWGILADDFIPECPGNSNNKPLRPCDIPRGSDLRRRPKGEATSVFHGIEQFFSNAMNTFGGFHP